MRKFVALTSTAIPMPEANIDTDQIIPARFLCKPREEGLAPYLFHDRRLTHAVERPDFVLNQAMYRGAGILVGGPNFGCGSSREHAICALLDAGIQVVLAAGISDIFINNALENGLLPISLPLSAAQRLLSQLEAAPGAEVSVDLETQCVVFPDGERLSFDIDARRKRCLLLGLDSIQLTLRDLATIEAFERSHQTWQPRRS